MNKSELSVRVILVKIVYLMRKNELKMFNLDMISNKVIIEH